MSLFTGTLFTVHVRFKGGDLLRGERAFKMQCSFEDPLREALFNGEVFLSGIVVGSTLKGVEHRIRTEMEEAGVSDLTVIVREEEGEDVEDTQGLQGREVQAAA